MGGFACVGSKGYIEKSVLSTQLCWELKIALKHSLFKKKKNLKSIKAKADSLSKIDKSLARLIKGKKGKKAKHQYQK